MVAPGESLHSEIATGADNYYVLHKKFKYHHPKGTGETPREGEKEEMMMTSTLTSSEQRPELPTEDSNRDGRESTSRSSVEVVDVETDTGNQPPPPPFSRSGSGDANRPSKDKPQYLIKWNRFEDQVCNAFAELFCSDEFVDVTISCEGEILRAHQVVLGLSSSFFRRIFQETPCEHPVVIIKGISPKILKSILQYIYLGEVVLQKNEINYFMDAADYLSICGVLANLYSCDISATSTVDESCTERDDSEAECSSMKYPEETESSSVAARLGELAEVEDDGDAEKSEQSDCQTPKEDNPGESESPVFKYQGIKSRWHRRYNSSTSYHGTPTASSPVNFEEQKRSASTGEMDTTFTLARDPTMETGRSQIAEALAPMEASSDAEMGSGMNDETAKHQMSPTEGEYSPDSSMARKHIPNTFFAQDFSNFGDGTDTAREYHSNYHRSTHMKSQGTFSSTATSAEEMDRSGFMRYYAPSQSSIYSGRESEMYPKYSGSPSTSNTGYDHAPHRPHVSLLSHRQAWQFQGDHHRPRPSYHQEKYFQGSSAFGFRSSSSLTTAASAFASASSSMNVTRPKTKAIRSSQVPQSSRYTAAEVDEMVDAVAHIPGNIVPCTICQKYVKRERLRAHIHECHLLTGEKIICPHCGIALKSKGSYRVHIWRHKRGALPARIGSGMTTMPMTFGINHPSGPPQ